VTNEPPDVGVAEPERRLMAAVLQRAVEDCQGPRSRRANGHPTMATGPRRISRARAYVASRDRTWPFSFDNLCDSLGLSAQRLRRALQSIPPN
jgi:hypothetical protein